MSEIQPKTHDGYPTAGGTSDGVFLHTIFETTPECIKIVGPDGRLLQMNPAGLRMVEADCWDSVAGVCTLDLIAPEHRELWGANHQRVCEGESVAWQFDIISLAGARRHMETHAAPIVLSDGRVGQLAITRDITKQKRLDEELRQSEQAHRALLQALPAAVYTTDAEGNITFFNEAAVQFAGRRPKPGEKWCVSWKLFSSEGEPLPHDQCPMAIALREGRPVRGVEAIAARPDGTRIPFMPFPTPMFDTDGKLVGAVNMLVDISDRKRAEEALQRVNERLEESVKERTSELERALTRLQESERNFTLLVGSVTDYAIYMLDPTGQVVSWNAGAERIKGYPADEIIGQHFSRFYAPEDAERGLPARGLERAAQEGRFEAEGWRVRKDGSRFWANVVIDAIKDGDRLIGFAKITRDITERKAAEAQLYQAQKMEAVGQLTGGVAHDFNNLLAAIIPSLELAKARISDERTLGYLDMAEHAAARGASLTHQLLAFSRKQHLARRSVDLNDLIGKMTAMLPRTLGPAVTIATDLDDATWPAMTDPGQLELAILNLAINARDAMPDGGVLSISTRNVEVDKSDGQEGLIPGSYVCVSVADTGVGMSEDVRQRAFEPFFSTKLDGRGSGLGLSMVYGFAQQAGGAIRIESEVGKGASVHIFVPRADTELHSLDQVPAGPQMDAGAPSRILVVDDDAAVRKTTADLIRDLGHQVSDADGGEAALAVLQEGASFDLMVVDLAMPNMNGAVFAIRARQLRPAMPVLFVTGYAGMTWESDVPGDELLKKPFTRVQMAAKLRSMLPRAPAPSAAASRANGADVAAQAM